MNEEMIKAPLDETNVSPTTIIDELTDGDNITKGVYTLGFINDYPFLFLYSSNVMRIISICTLDLDICGVKIRDYIKQMCENTKGLVVTTTYYKEFVMGGEIILSFYWDTKNK